MALYGAVSDVKQMLQPTIDTEWSDDDDDRLDRLQAAISLAIEDDLGRTFGAPISDTSRLIYAGPYDTLILPVPARSIARVTVGGTVNGGTVTGGTVYASSEWAHDPVALDGTILGLRRLSGGWWGALGWHGRPITPVVVVGDFTDTDDDTTVPDDITETANFLIAETYKYQHASPAGFVGPDGMTVPIRDPWKDPLVVRTLDKWRVMQRGWAV